MATKQGKTSDAPVRREPDIAGPMRFSPNAGKKLGQQARSSAAGRNRLARRSQPHARGIENLHQRADSVLARIEYGDAGKVRLIGCDLAEHN